MHGTYHLEQTQRDAANTNATRLERVWYPILVPGAAARKREQRQKKRRESEGQSQGPSGAQLHTRGPCECERHKKDKKHGQTTEDNKDGHKSNQADQGRQQTSTCTPVNISHQTDCTIK